jgi:hypothetical protein
MKKFLIFATSYDETNGGAIVLHKLCSILNELGYESYLHPYYETYEINKKNCIKYINKSIKSFLFPWRKKYKINPAFNTPVLKKTITSLSEEWVAIYPEIVFGNPLGAKNVVRWLLHQPGFHSGGIFYGKAELYFKFNSAINDFSFPGSTTSTQHLKVIHYPLEHYNSNSSHATRDGIAYSLRKTKNKPLQHDIENSVLIDGKTHKEISEIFKSVKIFISYDPYTAYSIFAVLCGCDSIVIPDEGVDENEWYPDASDRYGISYGFSKLDESRKTAHFVKDHVIEEEKKSIKNVQSCVAEIETFFK